MANTMLDQYELHKQQRTAEGIPPLPLNAEQVAQIVELLKNPSIKEGQQLLELLIHRVPPGVDQAAYVKAGFLAAIAKGESQSPFISCEKATELLGTMLGGYNIQPLIQLLDNVKLAPIAAKALSHTLLIFDAYHDVLEKAKNNSFAKQVIDSWAAAEWFNSKSPLAEQITVTVFKVPGETNTDDLSPAQEAWSRPDIPLHANAMLINRMPGALQALKN